MPGERHGLAARVAAGCCLSVGMKFPDRFPTGVRSHAPSPRWESFASNRFDR